MPSDLWKHLTDEQREQVLKDAFRNVFTGGIIRWAERTHFPGECVLSKEEVNRAIDATYRSYAMPKQTLKDQKSSPPRRGRRASTPGSRV